MQQPPYLSRLVLGVIIGLVLSVLIFEEPKITDNSQGEVVGGGASSDPNIICGFPTEASCQNACHPPTSCTSNAECQGQPAQYGTGLCQDQTTQTGCQIVCTCSAGFCVNIFDPLTCPNTNTPPTVGPPTINPPTVSNPTTTNPTTTDPTTTPPTVISPTTTNPTTTPPPPSSPASRASSVTSVASSQSVASSAVSSNPSSTASSTVSSVGSSTASSTSSVVSSTASSINSSTASSGASNSSTQSSTISSRSSTASSTVSISSTQSSRSSTASSTQSSRSSVSTSSTQSSTISSRSSTASSTVSTSSTQSSRSSTASSTLSSSITSSTSSRSSSSSSFGDTFGCIGEQWASGASATNEASAFPAVNIVGAPECTSLMSCGAQPYKIWMSQTAGQSAVVTVEFTFSTLADTIEIFESFYTRFVRRITLKNAGGEIIAGPITVNDNLSSPEYILTIPFAKTTLPVNTVVIETTPEAANLFAGIDAVRLSCHGSSSSARSSSTQSSRSSTASSTQSSLSSAISSTTSSQSSFASTCANQGESCAGASGGRSCCQGFICNASLICALPTSSSSRSSTATSVTSSTSSRVSSVTSSRITFLPPTVLIPTPSPIPTPLPIPVPPTQTYSCGDGVVQVQFGEQCDLGAVQNAQRVSCSPTCQITLFPQCGNKKVETGEECDDGNAVDFDGCSAQCLTENAECGNGVTERGFGEQCDLGVRNGVTGALCDVNCRKVIPPRCGDGVLNDASEQCDAGKQNGNYANTPCLESCTLPRCGDGIVQFAEQCDDGNLFAFDGCDATCQKEVLAFAPTEPELPSPTPIQATIIPEPKKTTRPKPVTVAVPTRNTDTGPELFIVMLFTGALVGMSIFRRNPL